jgi:hypothetical protein
MKSMDLFERYMQAVRKYLPWQRQDDIVAELRANLDAQREEREAELGRPLTEGEMIDWLKELGPPLQMAGRYQPPRYLIGPAIFPLYVKILRLVALWLTVAYAIALVARLFIESPGPDWVAGQIAAYPGVLLTAAAWITGVFAALEYASERYPDKCPDFMASSPRWSPTSLPQLDKEPPPGSKPRNLTTTLAEFIVQFALVIWLLLIPQYPFLLLGPGAAFLRHSPVRLTHICLVFFWAIVALTIVQFVWQGFNLFTGSWRIRRKVQHLATKAMGMIPIAILLTAPGRQYIQLNPAESGRLPAGFDIAKINHDVFAGLIAVACIVFVQFAWDLWKATSGAGQHRIGVVL